MTVWCFRAGQPSDSATERRGGVNLDFSGGPDFSAERMQGLAAFLKREIAGLGVGVKLPQSVVLPHALSRGVGVSTWRIDIETQPGRRDLPKQKIRLDIDNAPTHAGELREIAQNYGVLRDFKLLVHVQSREEVLANKLVAFPTSLATRNRPRHRDIWDMRRLAGNGTTVRGDLVRAKLRDHRADPSWLEAAAARARAIVRSPAFVDEMRRFLLPETARRTLDDAQYMEFLAAETERLIRESLHGLAEENEPPGEASRDSDLQTEEVEARPEPEESGSSPFAEQARRLMSARLSSLPRDRMAVTLRKPASGDRARGIDAVSAMKVDGSWRAG